MINADGSNAHLVLSNLPGSYFDVPAWSPDDKQIAITAFANDQTTPSQIYTANADGSDLKPLTHDPNGVGGATWSPDGKFIAYTGFIGGRDKIFIMNANGSHVHPLTSDLVSNNDFAAWSPIGDQIAFSSVCGSSPDCNGIVVINSDGTGRHIVHSAMRIEPDGTLANFNDIQPAWSPDGKQIVFHSDLEKIGLYIINTNSTNFHPLFTDFSVERGDAAWSPDGREIAFVMRRANFYNDIFVLDINSGVVRRLTTTGEKFDSFSPAWRPG